MPGAFLGVSHSFSAWAGGLPEYFATAGIAPCSCGGPCHPVILSWAQLPMRPARVAGLVTRSLCRVHDSPCVLLERRFAVHGLAWELQHSIMRRAGQLQAMSALGEETLAPRSLRRATGKQRMLTC